VNRLLEEYVKTVGGQGRWDETNVAATAKGDGSFATRRKAGKAEHLPGLHANGSGVSTVLALWAGAQKTVISIVRAERGRLRDPGMFVYRGGVLRRSLRECRPHGLLIGWLSPHHYRT
jgi:hypothetical protein